MLAAQSGKPEAVELLINSGADVNQEDQSARTALAYAVAMRPANEAFDNYMSIAALLMAAGAQTENSQGDSLHIVAAEKGNFLLSQKLGRWQQGQVDGHTPEVDEREELNGDWEVV